MRKSYRSLLVTGLVVAGVAACGDDVTIAPPPAGVNSVTVAPDGVTIAVGATLQMLAAVNADSGVATTVTWSSSDNAKATVSATGLVTAVAPGAVAIRACSTVNAGVCGAATVNIAAPVPATISIQAVTAGGTQFPVNINNVAGQIDVVLNFEPGTTPAQRVELLIDGAVVASQSFSAIEWAALVQKAQEEAVEKGGTLAQVIITLSVNTADFNTTTGVPRF
ncbi:MAG: Ig-like domain-containing protein, partial [Gemmatimonadales bacterium]